VNLKHQGRWLCVFHWDLREASLGCYCCVCSGLCVEVICAAAAAVVLRAVCVLLEPEAFTKIQGSVFFRSVESCHSHRCCLVEAAVCIKVAVAMSFGWFSWPFVQQLLGRGGRMCKGRDWYHTMYVEFYAINNGCAALHRLVELACSCDNSSLCCNEIGKSCPLSKKDRGGGGGRFGPWPRPKPQLRTHGFGVGVRDSVCVAASSSVHAARAAQCVGLLQEAT
jgi:hypothetical protein